MSDYPPFINAYGSLAKIIEKAKNAQTPDRFTSDFIEKTLGFKSHALRAFIPLAKRLGLLNTDGTPTDLYKSFRNQTQSQAAMATAIKKGYGKLYEKNENAHKLAKKELEGLIVELTGLEHGHTTVRSIVNTFQILGTFADFGKEIATESSNSTEKHEETQDGETGESNLKLNLAYTINLVLPKTDDVAVFNAIFRSLKENLLRP